MELFKVVVLAVILSVVTAFSSSSEASTCSFRLSNGKVIKCGMTMEEVTKRAGNPISSTYKSIDENQRRGYTRRSVFAYIYQIRGDIGGEFLVTVGFDNNDRVVLVETKQLKR